MSLLENCESEGIEGVIVGGVGGPRLVFGICSSWRRCVMSGEEGQDYRRESELREDECGVYLSAYAWESPASLVPARK